LESIDRYIDGGKEKHDKLSMKEAGRADGRAAGGQIVCDGGRQAGRQAGRGRMRSRSDIGYPDSARMRGYSYAYEHAYPI
jgi:hypothetical protein